MATRRVIILLSLLLATTVVALGCYTIIKHPSVMERPTYSDEDEADGEVSYVHTRFDRDCLRCHQDYSTYPYGYYYSHYPDYYWSYPRWGSYYAYPWWWNHYWYDDDYGYTEDDAQVVDKVEQPERRRGIAPPYTRGADPASPPVFNPGTSTPPVVGGSGGTGAGGTVDNPPPSKDDKPEQPKKPPKRRGGK